MKTAVRITKIIVIILYLFFFNCLRTGSQVEQGEKENRQAKQVEHGLGEKKDWGAYRINCFDATNLPTCNYPVTHFYVKCHYEVIRPAKL